MAFPAGLMPMAGPQPGTPVTPLPFMGIAPPPIGPRLPDPQALAELRAGIEKLLNAAEKDPLVGRVLNPIIETLMKARQRLTQPPTPPREEGSAGMAPLDHTPSGDVRGMPLSVLLPRLAGVGMR